MSSRSSLALPFIEKKSILPPPSLLLDHPLTFTSTTKTMTTKTTKKEHRRGRVKVRGERMLFLAMDQDFIVLVS